MIALLLGSYSFSSPRKTGQKKPEKLIIIILGELPRTDYLLGRSSEAGR